MLATKKIALISWGNFADVVVENEMKKIPTSEINLDFRMRWNKKDNHQASEYAYVPNVIHHIFSYYLLHGT